jgi:alpha-glucosidase (family GH31 glycosyl hydrolase)
LKYHYSQKLTHRERSVEVAMRIDEIGVYFRGGTILPAQKAGLNTMTSRKNPFEFIVALDDDQNASGTLYWDDGESIGKQNIRS